MAQQKSPGINAGAFLAVMEKAYLVYRAGEGACAVSA
jgi:hypothetical protein